MTGAAVVKKEATVNQFIFSIGIVPVQSFISEARRSKDLRAGSVILSWMMQKIIGYLAKNTPTVQLWIPKIPNPKPVDFATALQSTEYSLPNRVTGQITRNGDLDGVASHFKMLNAELNRWWKEEIFQPAFENQSGREHLNLFKNIKFDISCQTCPLQVVWVISPFVISPFTKDSDHKDEIAKIDRRYRDIKRTRSLTVVSNGKAVDKCGICGIRECIGPKTHKENRTFFQKLSQKDPVKIGYRIEAAERLCAECLTKRFAGYLDNDEFPSTNAIALQDWLSEVNLLAKENPAIQKALNNYQDKAKIKNNKLFWFPRNLDNLESREKLGRYTQNAYKLNPTLLKETLQELQKAIEQTKAGIKKSPCNYLAIIVFDGDSMGKKMRQHFDHLPEFIGEFARQTIAAIHRKKPYHAEIVYCGGDEGLLFCPLSTAILTAEKINELFQTHVNTKIDGDDLSISAGISIFDSERPMADALKAAHEMLSWAKAIDDDKNALAVHVQTASGSRFWTRAKWDNKYWKYLVKAVSLMLNKDDNKPTLSSRWPYEIEAFIHSLPEWTTTQPQFSKAVTAEARRITFRKLSLKDNGNSNAILKKKAEIWKDQLHGEEWFKPGTKEIDRQEFAEQLHLIAFLSKEHIKK
jgi:CRISPR-associated protein Cmr2